MTQTRKPLFNRTYLWALACLMPAVILLLDASRPPAPECSDKVALCTLVDNNSDHYRLSLMWPTGLSPVTDNRQLAPALASAVQLQLQQRQSTQAWQVQLNGFDQLRLQLTLPASPDADQTLAAQLSALKQQLQIPLTDQQLRQLASEQQARNYLRNQKPQQQAINNLYNTLSPTVPALTLTAAYQNLLERPMMLAASGPDARVINTLTGIPLADLPEQQTLQPNAPSIRLRHNGILLVGQRIAPQADVLLQQVLSGLIANRLEQENLGYRIISQRQQPFGIRALLLNEADWPAARQLLHAPVNETELERIRAQVANDYKAVFNTEQGRHQVLETRLFYPQGTPTQAGFHDTLDALTTELLQQALHSWLGLAENPALS